MFTPKRCLINDKKADVSEANIRRYQAMGGNNDVDTAIGQSDEHSLLLSGGAKSAEELYGDRIALMRSCSV